MEKKQCQICHLPIDIGDSRYGRVIVRPEGSVHTYCEEMISGQIPACPLYESIRPRPVSRDCAIAVNNPKLVCENMVCQIGKSMRVLRGIDPKPSLKIVQIPKDDFFGREFAIMIYGEGIRESAFFQAFDGTCPECGVNPDKCPPNDKYSGLDGFWIPFGCYDCNHFNLVPLVALRETFEDDEIFTIDCEECRAQIDIPDTVICSKCGIFLRKDAQRLIDECNNRSSVMLYYRRA